VFLDRDGTLIHDAGYLKDPAGVFVLPRVPEALAQLSDFALVIASNQSGVGRGLFSRADLERVHRRVIEALPVPFAGAFYCPHAPDELCACRKPKPGLLFEARDVLNLDLSRSFMIGDRESDVDAGLAAGCRPVLLDSATPDLLAAARLIRA
jgi:D-glycero-D-manno-heptose 1,7-bisphosphate phosphatase